jgi:TM2 domain-containing membrane protein YozV
MRLTITLVLMVAAMAVVGVDGWAIKAEEVKCRLKSDPLIAGGASFLVPGLGQFMNGQDGKGLVHLIVGVALPTAVVFSATLIAPISPLAAILLVYAVPVVYLGWVVHSALDAYNVAGEYCRP